MKSIQKTLALSLLFLMGAASALEAVALAEDSGKPGVTDSKSGTQGKKHHKKKKKTGTGTATETTTNAGKS